MPSILHKLTYLILTTALWELNLLSPPMRKMGHREISSLSEVTHLCKLQSWDFTRLIWSTVDTWYIAVNILVHVSSYKNIRISLGKIPNSSLCGSLICPILLEITKLSSKMFAPIYTCSGWESNLDSSGYKEHISVLKKIGFLECLYWDWNWDYSRLYYTNL